jgi:hypothetical protein
MSVKGSIHFMVKVKNQRTINANVDVNYNDELAEIKVTELGDMLAKINPTAMIEVGYSVFNSISGTWMQMTSYYADEKRFIKH